MRLLCTLPKHLTKFGIEVMISNSSTMEKTFWTATFRGVVCCSVVVCRRCSLWNFSCWWRAAAGWGRSILTVLPDRYASFLNKKSQKQPTSVKIIAKKFIYGGGNLKGEMHATLNACKISTTMHCAKWGTRTAEPKWVKNLMLKNLAKNDNIITNLVRLLLLVYYVIICTVCLALWTCLDIDNDIVPYCNKY